MVDHGGLTVVGILSQDLLGHPPLIETPATPESLSQQLEDGAVEGVVEHHQQSQSQLWLPRTALLALCSGSTSRERREAVLWVVQLPGRAEKEGSGAVGDITSAYLAADGQNDFTSPKRTRIMWCDVGCL